VLNRIEILNELEGISPFVAKIGTENLYQIPTGYFDRFSNEVMARIKANQTDSAKAELEALSPLVSKISRQVSFNIPEDYFENFSATVLDKINSDFISNELKEISPLLGNTERQNPFNVPTGYFENFASDLMSRIKAEESKSADEELENLSPFLSKLNKKTPFSLPDNYFKELAGNAMAGAKAVEFVNDELENLPTVLSELKNKSVYEVPQNYFENFSASVLDKVKTQHPAKVISIGKKTNWLRYAAAAVVIGFIATTVVFVVNRKNNAPTFSYSKIDEKQLTDSLQNANDDDISNYMQSHSISMSDVNNSVASLDGNDNDDDDMLADVSDNELQQYVEQNGGPKEPTTN